MLNLPETPQGALSKLAFKGFLFVIGALAVFSAGMYLGHALGSSAWKGKAFKQAENSSIVIAKKEGETSQCRAQVDKANAANMKLAEELAAKNKQDKAAREQASREAVARDRQSRERNNIVLTALEQLRDDITTGKFDACTGTIADSDILRLLNETIANNRSDNAGRDGDVPPSGDGG
jgi:hypothetical protein